MSFVLIKPILDVLWTTWEKIMTMERNIGCMPSDPPLSVELTPSSGTPPVSSPQNLLWPYQPYSLLIRESLTLSWSYLGISKSHDPPCKHPYDRHLGRTTVTDAPGTHPLLTE